MRQQFERQAQRHHDRNVDVPEVETTEHAPSRNTLRHELDEILDEIDEVLEQNAEEFVKGFVQKGGE